MLVAYAAVPDSVPKSLYSDDSGGLVAPSRLKKWLHSLRDLYEVIELTSERR